MAARAARPIAILALATLLLAAAPAGARTAGDEPSPAGATTAGAPIDMAVELLGPPRPWRPGQLRFTAVVTGAPDLAGELSFGVDTRWITAPGTYTFDTASSGGALEPKVTFQSSTGDYVYATLPKTMVSWDTDEENYVVAAYARLFGRFPDAAGRTYWADRIRGGLSRDRYALAQVASSEYRRQLAKRNGLVPWSATPAQAKPVVDALATKTVRQLLVAQWAAASRVTTCVDGTSMPVATAGTFDCWARMLYATFAGHTTAADQAHAHTFPNTVAGRTALATELIYGQHAIEGVVGAAYGAYLGRSPDPSGLAYWTKKIQTGTREEGVEARVLGSAEFFRRTLLPPADR